MSETLTWDGEALVYPIVAEDLGRLRKFVTRGTNLVMPTAQGTRPYPPIMDELDETLVWAVTGRHAAITGTPHASQELGLEVNLEHYRALFTTGADPDTGEHDISLDYAGLTFTAGAQLREYDVVRTGPGTAKILTRLVIAAGEMDPAGP